MTITSVHSRPFHAPKVGRHLQDEPIHYKIVSGRDCRHDIRLSLPVRYPTALAKLRASQATLSACINSIYLLRNGLTFIALYTDIRLFIVKIILFRQQ